MFKKIVYPIIAIFVGCIVSLSYTFGLFTGLEYYFEDTLFQKRPISNDIIIVAIDDDSINKIGQWPWPRGEYAKFLDILNNNPPRVLGIDVVWSEESRVGKVDDDKLKDSLNRVNYRTVIASEATWFELKNDEGLVSKKLNPIFKIDNEKVSTGLVNVITDSDSVVRNFPMYSRDISGPVDSSIESFALAVSKGSGIGLPNEANLKKVNRIVYAGNTNSIRRIPFHRVVYEPNVSKELENKVVLLGATAENLHDTKPTPMSRGTEMPGVEIHGNIVNMLLNGYIIDPFSPTMNIISILVVAIISAIVFIFISSLSLAVLINAILGIFYLVIIVILFDKGIAVNLIHIELSAILSTASFSLYRIFVAEKDKRQMKKTFAKYVSPAVLDQIVAHPEKVVLGGEEKMVTVLFSDIRSFTSISERTKPRELVRILNTYFSGVTNKIIENDGVLDKYIGDAIMAFWGAPIDDENQADKAVSAAISMLEELKRLNKDFKANGDPEIEIGIGIYTGLAIVGNVGSEHRFDYTVIGDTVNAASRLEGLNKEYKTHIIIGENTKKMLKKDYSMKALGEATVKGKAETITIYSVE